MQFWGDGSVGNNAGYTDILNGGGNTVQVSLNTTGGASGVGQYTIGTFVADATSQTFTVNGNWGNSGQINAMQWRFLGNAGGGHHLGGAGDGFSGH